VREANFDRSDDSSQAVDPTDWAPSLASNAMQLKWGFNGETGEVTVWEVAGPGDGFPSHRAYLTTAWGRAPQGTQGDVVGFAEWRPPTLAIHVYRAELPAAVEAHFRTVYPGAHLVLS
jgi:hypothetical protein